MWKKILLWIGRQIAQAAIEEASTRIAKKRAAAESARAEALKLARMSVEFEEQASRLEKVDPVELLSNLEKKASDA